MSPEMTCSSCGQEGCPGWEECPCFLPRPLLRSGLSLQCSTSFSELGDLSRLPRLRGPLPRPRLCVVFYFVLLGKVVLGWNLSTVLPPRPRPTDGLACSSVSSTSLGTCLWCTRSFREG